jgi:hypothetical protein
MEAGDDDITNDRNHGMMTIRSWKTTKVQRQVSEDDSQTHGNKERFKFFHT